MTPSPSERRIDARRRLRALVLGPLLAVVLAGCGSSSTPGPTGGSPVEASSVPSSTRDPAASASPSARVAASPTPSLPEVVDRGSWHKGTPMPIRRGEVQATVLNGRPYSAGGSDRGHGAAAFA